MTVFSRLGQVNGPRVRVTVTLEFSLTLASESHTRVSRQPVPVSVLQGF